MRDYMMIQADQALDTQSRQADQDAGNAWEWAWLDGFHMYQDGLPYAQCRSEAERRGWKCAKRTSGSVDLTKDQLEALGI